MEAVTERDVNINAKAAVSALEEVCYVLGKDKTYDEMQKRITPPKVGLYKSNTVDPYL